MANVALSLIKREIRDFLWEQFRDNWNALIDETPSRIFHYTNPTGFMAIIDSNSLHATNVGYLNDESELHYVRDIVCGLIDDWAVRKGTRKQQLLALIRDQLDDALAAAGNSLFVVSFSNDKDDLTQWRSYGGAEGGFAIGFSSTELRESLRRHSTSRPFRAVLRPVLYGRERIEELATKFLSSSLTKFEKRMSGQTAKQASELIEIWKDALLYRLIMMAPLGKHQQFKSENEWRIVATLRDDPPLSAVAFKPKSTVLVA